MNGSRNSRQGLPAGMVQRLLNRLTFDMPGGYSLRPWLQRLRGVRIGKGVWISRWVYIDELHPEVVSIGDNSTIGLRSSIITHLYWGPRTSASQAGAVVIEHDVFVGPHCLILPGVTIGYGAVIQGGTVVSRDVPAQTLWGTSGAGPRARVGVPLTHDHSYEGFMAALRPLRNEPEPCGVRNGEPSQTGRAEWKS